MAGRLQGDCGEITRRSKGDQREIAGRLQGDCGRLREVTGRLQGDRGEVAGRSRGCCEEIAGDCSLSHLIGGACLVVRCLHWSGLDEVGEQLIGLPSE